MDSDAVNEYLREITGQSFTAKDFRTWAGTLLAAQALQELEAADSDTAARRNVVRAIERVAERLGNTPAVCRKCYVHPEIIAAYLEGTITQPPGEPAGRRTGRSSPALSPEEAAVMALLSSRLERNGAGAAAQ